MGAFLRRKVTKVVCPRPQRITTCNEEHSTFAGLNASQQNALIAFLNSLVLFPPDDTASNLDPGNPNDPDFPQVAHGSIKLTVLFNDPTDLE